MAERGRGRGGDRGVRRGLAPGMRPVSEASRITLQERVEAFRISDDESLTFEADLTNHDRAILHDLCKKLGLKSKSHGSGANRRLTISKTARQATRPADNAYDLTFCPQSTSILEDHFAQFPPTAQELRTLAAAAASAPSRDPAMPADHKTKTAGRRDPLPANPGETDGATDMLVDQPVIHDGPGQESARGVPGLDNPAPGGSSQRAKALMAKAAAHKTAVAASLTLQRIEATRLGLPIAALREEIVTAVQRHQVVMVAGETGSGKTTQVPQYVLEDCWERGMDARMIVTQPRRISAMSVADRVAAERGESVGGGTVGYQVRLESKGNKDTTAIMFMTNGVLVRKLCGGRGGGRGPDECGSGSQNPGGGGGRDQEHRGSAPVGGNVAAAGNNNSNDGKKNDTGDAAGGMGGGGGAGGGGVTSGGAGGGDGAVMGGGLPPGLKGVTHIVVDEIHERDRFADFMLIILRDVLPRAPHLRLILMSATLQVDLFSRYFRNCPVIQVSGRTFPVREIFLEDVLAKTGYVGDVRQLATGEYAEGNTLFEAGKILDAKISRREDPVMDELIERAWKEGTDASVAAMMQRLRDSLAPCPVGEGRGGGAGGNGAAAGGGTVTPGGAGGGKGGKGRKGGGAPRGGAGVDGDGDVAIMEGEEEEDDEDDVGDDDDDDDDDDEEEQHTGALSDEGEGAEGEVDAGGSMAAVVTAGSLLDYQHPQSGATALMVVAGQGRGDEVAELLSLGADAFRVAGNGSRAVDWAYIFDHAVAASLLEEHMAEMERTGTLGDKAQALHKYQMSVDADVVDIPLIVALLKYIVGGGWRVAGDYHGHGHGHGHHGNAGMSPVPDGAILVFLPGWQEISELMEELRGSAEFGDGRKYLVLPLHSMVAPKDQRMVFQPAPKGARKIILSTNIAEASVTIDDVVYVINSGRVKEKSYDPHTATATLQLEWISRANEKQRKGRAGRVRPGVCYHLYSRHRSRSLAEFMTCEMRRMPLEEIVLNVKQLGYPGPCAGFLAKAVEPPAPKSVRNAVRLLEDIGALDADERLTVLGRKLASLPLNPVVGKMLLRAIPFQCLDPLLTVACASSHRDPFVLPPPHLRAQADGCRARLSYEYGGASDHLAVVAAYQGWEHARAQGRESRYCEQNFLSPATMSTLAGMRKQLLGELGQLRLLPPPHLAPRPLEWANENSHDVALVRSILCAGMYPCVGRAVVSPGGKVVVHTKAHGKVRVHKSSVNARLRAEGGGGRGSGGHSGGGGDEDLDKVVKFVAYDELTRGDHILYTKLCTVASPAFLPFFALSVGRTRRPDEARDPGPGAGVGGAGLVTSAGNGAAEGGDAMDLGEEGGAGHGGGDPSGQGSYYGTDGEGYGDQEYGEDGMARLLVDEWLVFKQPPRQAQQMLCLRERFHRALAWMERRPTDPLPPAEAHAMAALQGLLSLEGEAERFRSNAASAATVAARGGRGAGPNVAGGGRGNAAAGGGRGGGGSTRSLLLSGAPTPAPLAHSAAHAAANAAAAGAGGGARGVPDLRQVIQGAHSREAATAAVRGILARPASRDAHQQQNQQPQQQHHQQQRQQQQQQNQQRLPAQAAQRVVHQEPSPMRVPASFALLSKGSKRKAGNTVMPDAGTSELSQHHQTWQQQQLLSNSSLGHHNNSGRRGNNSALGGDGAGSAHGGRSVGGNRPKSAHVTGTSSAPLVVPLIVPFVGEPMQVDPGGQRGAQQGSGARGARGKHRGGSQ
eukprot:jgi/Mesvir1/10635/Mv09273-RA.1